MLYLRLLEVHINQYEDTYKKKHTVDCVGGFKPQIDDLTYYCHYPGSNYHAQSSASVFDI